MSSNTVGGLLILAFLAALVVAAVLGIRQALATRGADARRRLAGEVMLTSGAVVGVLAVLVAVGTAAQGVWPVAAEMAVFVAVAVGLVVQGARLRRAGRGPR